MGFILIKTNIKIIKLIQSFIGKSFFNQYIIRIFTVLLTNKIPLMATKIVLSERTEKGVKGGAEKELGIFTIEFTPFIGMKWWENEELHKVVDMFVQRKTNKQYRLDIYEIYLEVLIEKV